MSRATIIIPVHNRRAVTLACLQHLQATGDLGRFTVIVVDDGSTDGTGEAVQAGFPEVELLRGDGNLWWTGAIALGMQRAFNTGAVAVCWLNDDCLPAAGTLQALLTAASVSPGQAVAPACFNAESGASVPIAFASRTRLDATSGQILLVDGLSGYCVVVPRAIWSRIGLPDARRFPHYFGDTAYTLQATQAGFSCAILGDVRAELTGFRAPPALLSLYDPAGGWRRNFSRMFRSPKSAYRLRTLLAFLQLKYGLVSGTALAVCRAGGWIAQLAWAEGRARIRPLRAF